MRKTTFLYQVHQGIGNCIHATHVAKWLSKEFDLTVLTNHPEIFNNMPFGKEAFKVFGDDAVLPVDYDYMAWSLFHSSTERNFNVQVTIPPPVYKAGMHETEINALPIEKEFNVRLNPQHREIRIPEIKTPGYSLRKSLRDYNGIVALCNGGTTTEQWKRKRWPSLYWDKLAGLLREAGYYTIAIGQVGDDIENVHQAVLGQELGTAFNILSQCDYCIATDCGLMHAADVLDIPLLAIFGMTFIDKNGPLGFRSKIINDDSCIHQPCQRTQLQSTCPDVRCMTKLTPETVFGAFQFYYSQFHVKEQIQ